MPGGLGLRLSPDRQREGERHERLTEVEDVVAKAVRRALHPHAQGEPALGADLRHRRGASAGAARLSGELQHNLAHRTARVPDTRGRATEPAFNRGTGRVASIRCLTDWGRYRDYLSAP